MESINYKLFPPEVECVNVAAFLVNGAILLSRVSANGIRINANRI